MRNDNRKWPPAESTESFIQAPMDLGVATLTPIELSRQTLISGPQVLAQVNAPLISWPDITDTQNYALCLRRDTVLLIDETQTNKSDRGSGWDEANQQAISDASDTFAVFTLSGPHALELLQRGAEITLQSQSPSVQRLLFGFDAMIYRAAREDQYRVHIAWARLPSLIDQLQSAAAQV